MTFKPGDQVLVHGRGPYTVYQSDSSIYPLEVNNCTYTPEGYIDNVSTKPSLTHYDPPSVTTYPLGKVQTLDNGIQIYHPNEGQPFQLTPTYKELI